MQILFIKLTLNMRVFINSISMISQVNSHVLSNNITNKIYIQVGEVKFTRRNYLF